MNSMLIPFSFIRLHALLSWRDALWGYERQIIGWLDIVALAKDKLSLDSDAREFELACLNKSDSFRVGGLLRELAVSEREELGLMSRKKWLFLILAWALDKRYLIADPLSVVEKVYADFDYPSEIESFVRYMPIMDDYDPSHHSKEENENRLFKNWKNYLEVAGHKVQAISSLSGFLYDATLM